MGSRRPKPADKHAEKPSAKSLTSERPPASTWRSLGTLALALALAVVVLAACLAADYRGAFAGDATSRLPLSPENVARVCAEARERGPELDQDLRARLAAGFDREAVLAQATALGQSGDFAQAVGLLTEVLHHNPADEEARRMLHVAYRRLYPHKRGDRSKNFTRLVLTRLQNLAASGQAVSVKVGGPGGEQQLELRVVQARTSPPVFIVEGLFTDQECDRLVAEHDQRRERYTRNGLFPVMCFKHDLYFKHPEIRPSLVARSQGGGLGQVGKYCLDQQASRAVNERIDDRRSFSLSLGNHQSALADSLRKRMGEVLGLNPKHANWWQMLEYPTGVSYEEHTDCGHDGDWQEDRLATFLAPLLDDFDGGETTFPLADPPLSLKVRRGTGIVFWNFGLDSRGVPKCSRLSSHASKEVTRGRKLMVQQWFNYAEDAFRSQISAPAKELPWVLPHQPWVSCDYVDGRGAEGISCRWYNNAALDLSG